LDEAIRVVICDDHAVVRSGLRAILATEDRIDVIAEAATVAAAVKAARDLHPDVFIMDLSLPDGTGLDATRLILEASPTTHVVILTVHDDVAYLRESFAAGAIGYLNKEAADLELVFAVRQAASGRRYVDPRLAADLLSDPVESSRLAGPGGELSEREEDVLRLIARGYTNAQMAEELFLSIRTIETHRAHVQQKLGVRNRAALVRAATEAGLTDN
jgi:two-component system response regulator NreC